MHDELKEHRQKQRNIQAKAHADQDALDNLENRQRMQADDVQRMRDREVIKERVRLMEVMRPIPAYREAKARFATAKESKKEAIQKLAKLKEEVEPSLAAINAKTAYQRQIEAVVNGRRRMAQDAEKIADNIDRKLQTLHSRKGELEAEAEAEKNGGRESRKDITRQQGFIATLKRRMDEEQPDLDISAYNERIRGKQKAIDEAAQKVLELKRQMEDITSRGQGRKERIIQAQKELQKLESQAGQRENKLRQASQDTFKAWEWIKEHQDQFEKPVFGPPMVECSVTDPKYVDQIETLLQRGQMLMITCQTKNDFKKLGDILHDRMHLAEINMQHMTGTLADFLPPIDRDQLGRYGLTGWALDYISGPEPVMAMLCANVRLERTGVGDQDTTPEQFELLQNGPIENWVTKRSSYKIVRRREYGPSATSTNVRDVRRAQVWTNQPIDIRAKRDLQENIEGWTGEITEFQSQVATAQKEIEELRDTVRETQDEVRNLQTEKAGKQKLLSDFRALPTKLAQQEEKLATAQQSLSEMRQRLRQISEKREQLTGERAEAAMDYVAAVETLQARHLELYEAEIMLIEANSDLATLAGKNAAQQELLELREREVEHLGKEVKERRENAMRLVDKVKEVMAAIEQSADAALAEHVRTMSDQQSSEQLEEEIESEKARLELMHEGNDRGIIKEFESREKRIGTLRSNLEGLREELEQAGERIQGVRERWEPELDRLVGLISKSFGENMKEIGCAGEVGVSKEDDFENWSIKILVKFRYVSNHPFPSLFSPFCSCPSLFLSFALSFSKQNKTKHITDSPTPFSPFSETEPLTALDSHRQSGGERAVSTIFYLMSLQSLTRSPFRVVDEINQGMDPRNERLVHRRMVGIACGGDGLLNDSSSSSNGANGGAAAEGRSFDSVTVVNGDGDEDDAANAKGGRDGEGATIPQSQYFLITPKLLPSLTYARGMRVLCIASGEHMPASADKVDFRGCVDLARGLRREVAVR